MTPKPDDLRLRGVDHTAFPTAKPKETIEFYRDLMGLPVLHAITAKGWGWKGGYPDFFHFFFDAGEGSTIAFFYHIGSPPPARPADPLGYQAQARHTAWLVDTEDELRAWHAHLKAAGVKVTPAIQHELIESIYFLDPNDYPLEITRRLRPLEDVDRRDADLTLRAIAQTFGPNPEGTSIQGPKIDDVWRRKADLVGGRLGVGLPAAEASLVLLDVPEYRPVRAYAERTGLEVRALGADYYCISSPDELALNRTDVGLSEALWFSMLVGGLRGEIIEYTADDLRIRRRAA